ncbi:MAG TPA: DNA gyrase C-terminal beta-propeller domain-containing protein, partial [Acidimicrobiales bacterium]|nr:DNA gyrase C-terminal beta-propeller domain-containing protein [Acidimicrobiales bacterium]
KKFKLSQIQTDHILDMPLKRLTALEKLRIEEERDDLVLAIDGYEKLLKSEAKQRTLVLSELNEAVEKFGQPRKTEITHPDDLPVFEVIEEVQDVVEEPCVVTLSTSGQIGRMPVDGARRANPGRHDILSAAILTQTTSKVTAVTSEGRALQIFASELADASNRTRGSSAAQVFGANRGEVLHTLVADGKEHAVIITSKGIVKRLTLDEIRETRSRQTLINLKKDDHVAAAFCAPERVDILLVSSDGQVLCTPVEDVSVQGRGAAGIAGMKLKGGAKIVAAGVVLADDVLYTITNRSSIKATPTSEFESRGRNGVGVRVNKIDEGEELSFAWVGQPLGLLATMCKDDDPQKVDPNPMPLMIEATKRDLSSGSTERQILSLGPGRW